VNKPSNGTIEAEFFLLLDDELMNKASTAVETESRRPGATQASGTTIERLRELEQMRREGLITEGEFKAKRRKLIEAQ
jgi:hypothetical protein